MPNRLSPRPPRPARQGGRGLFDLLIQRVQYSLSRHPDAHDLHRGRRQALDRRRGFGRPDRFGFRRAGVGVDHRILLRQCIRRRMARGIIEVRMRHLAVRHRIGADMSICSNVAQTHSGEERVRMAICMPTRPALISFVAGWVWPAHTGSAVHTDTLCKETARVVVRPEFLPRELHLDRTVPFLRRIVLRKRDVVIIRPLGERDLPVEVVQFIVDEIVKLLVVDQHLIAHPLRSDPLTGQNAWKFWSALPACWRQAALLRNRGVSWAAVSSAFQGAGVAPSGRKIVLAGRQLDSIALRIVDRFVFRGLARRRRAS